MQVVSGRPHLNPSVKTIDDNKVIEVDFAPKAELAAA